ncbi:4'-phosphopantetheinyl transferase family protein [Rathayibacter tanaceti]|nr:4'-phosphopantetheinyl transferase superfamily protein [Rathayibacter tanaceti]KZX22305.1 holo-(acyl carrier protein) synthase 2 [Rathayibacter tanaceti]
MQRAVLARYLGVTAAQVRIDRRCARCGGPHGRPSVPGAGIDFSVSHSGGRVVIAVVGSERVGVDVQMPAAEISRHFLAKALDPAESAALEALPAASRLRALTQQWCRTEAAAKLTGVGVLAGVRAEPGAQRLPVSLVDLDLGGGLVGALASSRPIDRIRRGT